MDFPKPSFATDRVKPVVFTPSPTAEGGNRATRRALWKKNRQARKAAMKRTELLDTLDGIGLLATPETAGEDAAELVSTMLGQEVSSDALLRDVSDK